MTAVLVLSGTSKCGTPPITSRARIWASIQSGSACVQLACAKVKLDAPSTATKICALRISPVSRSMMTGTPIAGVIDEQPLAGRVRLPHRRRQLRFKAAIELAKPRIAVTAGIGGDIFIPDDHQGDVLALQLPMNRRPIRLSVAAIAPVGSLIGVERRLPVAVAHAVRQGPTQPGALETPQRLANRRGGYAQPTRDLAR